MSTETLWGVAIFTVALLGIAGFMADLPSLFRVPALRFLYRGGLLLYARTFPMPSPARGSPLRRWQVEHWSQSSILIPFAEQDGPDRVIMTWFVRLGLFHTTVPPLTRAVISLRRDKNLVSVRGYANWTYVVLATYVFMLAWATRESTTPSASQCAIILGLVYFLVCGVVYIAQMAHFARLGSAIAEQLPTQDE